LLDNRRNERSVQGGEGGHPLRVVLMIPSSCCFCGKEYSGPSNLANFSHVRTHVRNGELIEVMCVEFWRGLSGYRWVTPDRYELLEYYWVKSAFQLKVESGS